MIGCVTDGLNNKLLVWYSGHVNSKLLVWYSGHGLNNELLAGIWIAKKWKFDIQMLPLFRCSLFRSPLYLQIVVNGCFICFDIRQFLEGLISHLFHFGQLEFQRRFCRRQFIDWRFKLGQLTSHVGDVIFNAKLFWKYRIFRKLRSCFKEILCKDL